MVIAGQRSIWLTLPVTGSNSNGEFPTLGAAVSSLSGGGSACIFVYGGTYKENFTISYGGPLTIYGYTTE